MGGPDSGLNADLWNYHPRFRLGDRGPVRPRFRGDNGCCPRGLTMNAETLRRLKRSPTIQKRLAKFMVFSELIN